MSLTRGTNVRRLNIQLRTITYSCKSGQLLAISIHQGYWAFVVKVRFAMELQHITHLMSPEVLWVIWKCKDLPVKPLGLFRQSANSNTVQKDGTQRYTIRT